MKSLPLLCAALCASASFAADPVSAVKPIPPPGIEVPAEVRSELTAGVEALGKEIAALKTELAAKPELLELLPDVEIFHKSVDWSLRYNEFFDAKHFDVARKHLALGTERAKALREGKAPWNEQTGLVVRGYRSKIDGSVQPYGLVIPEAWKLSEKTPRRLDFWFHGRGEKLSELSFLQDRISKKGEFAPEDAMVLHLYGRYCNANKFAGERDLFEAWEHAKKHYPIDPDRVVIRGFSMGGAAAWQFATHFPGHWAAAAPGAGFAETAEFFKSFAPGKTPPPWWEQVLWRWYDATLYARNLVDLPLIAYSGEKDGQKQAADIMLRYAEKEGVTFPHVIGPAMGHKYHPDSKPKIDAFIADALTKKEPWQKAGDQVRFTTYTSIYPMSEWVLIDSMEKQWERADVDAKFVTDNEVQVKARGVTGLTLLVSAGVKITLDGTLMPAGLEQSQGFSFRKENGKWVPGKQAFNKDAPHKHAEFCGPVDHGFMSRFVMVRPTGKALNKTVGKWVAGELEHATDKWRKVFRGEAPAIDDSALSDEQIRDSNLILWGDPSSNSVLARILPKLPIKWTKDGLVVGKYTYDAAHHAPILIFPNPLNPSKYVVINSGPTMRERAAVNNSDQTPKLPDWAVVDLRTPPDAQWPGLVLDAGFFDEQWRLQ